MIIYLCIIFVVGSVRQGLSFSSFSIFRSCFYISGYLTNNNNYDI